MVLISIVREWLSWLADFILRYPHTQLAQRVNLAIVADLLGEQILHVVVEKFENFECGWVLSQRIMPHHKEYLHISGLRFGFEIPYDLKLSIDEGRGIERMEAFFREGDKGGGA